MTSYRRYRVNRQNQEAFTLIELLVVIAVIALLMGILLPALSLVRNLDKRVVCQNNLHQCVAAMFMYAGDFDDALPIGSIIDRTAPGYTASWEQADQMAMVNAETMRHLGETYGLTEEHATCETARNTLRPKRTGWNLGSRHHNIRRYSRLGGSIGVHAVVGRIRSQTRSMSPRGRSRIDPHPGPWQRVSVTTDMMP